MFITFTECNCSDNSLFVDLAKYSDVYEWAQDIISRKDALQPLHASITFGGIYHPIIRNGKVMEDAADVLSKLKSIRKCYRKIPSDKLTITSDGFERDLDIDLNI